MPGSSSKTKLNQRLVGEPVPLTGNMACSRRSAALTFFYLLNAVTIVVALGALTANALVLALATSLSAVEIATRVYAIVFCIGIVFAELEWPEIMRDAVLLRQWPIRGLLYTFVGLLTLEISDFADENGVASVFHNAFGWILVGVGICYFVLGVLCMHRVRDKQLERQKAATAADAAFAEATARRAQFA